jgi:hypothetical protein
MAVSKRTRYEVLRRDNFTCRYCRSTEGELTVDHVTPVALGGTDDPSNLVAACKDCNAGKASTSPDATTVEDVSQSEMRWAGAIQAAAEARAAAARPLEAYLEAFDAKWANWTYGRDSLPIPRPNNWRTTGRQFYAAHLPIEELCEAVDFAAGNDRVRVDGTWRYMCGIAWTKIRQIQEAARLILDAEEVGR